MYIVSEDMVDFKQNDNNIKSIEVNPDKTKFNFEISNLNYFQENYDFSDKGTLQSFFIDYIKIPINCSLDCDNCDQTKGICNSQANTVSHTKFLINYNYFNYYQEMNTSSDSKLSTYSNIKIAKFFPNSSFDISNYSISLWVNPVFNSLLKNRNKEILKFTFSELPAISNLLEKSFKFILTKSNVFNVFYMDKFIKYYQKAEIKNNLNGNLRNSLHEWNLFIFHFNGDTSVMKVLLYDKCMTQISSLVIENVLITTINQFSIIRVGGSQEFNNKYNGVMIDLNFYPETFITELDISSSLYLIV